MTEYQKLEKLISDARALIEKQVTNSNTDFEAWEVNVRRFLSKKYGEKSIEYKKFDDTSFFSGCWGIDTTDEEFHSDCVKLNKEINARLFAQTRNCSSAIRTKTFYKVNK